jgi:4-alpha-glucanotransferase
MTAGHSPKGTDPTSADAMHHALARTRSALAMVQVECALDIVAQPNLPGTVDEYPSWRQRLPTGPGALAQSPGIQRAARILNGRKPR